MSYEIKVTGLKEPIRAENHGATSVIKEKWEKFKKGEIEDILVTISGWTGTLKSIIYFKEIKSSSASTSSFDIYYKDQREKWLKDRLSFRNLPLEIKSKQVDFFRMIYWGFTGRKSEEIKIGDTPIEEIVINIHKEFFTNNPKRTLCDPILYKKVIKSVTCHDTITSTIEKAIMEDRKFALYY